MPTDHQGQRISGNYRPTPRLSQLMARQMTNTAFKPTSEVAQEMLDEYRFRRDFGDQRPDFMGNDPAVALSNDQAAISEAIKNRKRRK